MTSTTILEPTRTDISSSNGGRNDLVALSRQKGSYQTFSTPGDRPSYAQVGNQLIEWEKFVSPTSKHIDTLFLLMRFSKKWSDEGIAEPTMTCKVLASNMAKQLFFRESLIPIRVLPSIEEGIMLTYHNPENSKTLMIEIYNDGDIAGIVNQNKMILICHDVKNEDFKDLIDAFNEDT